MIAVVGATGFTGHRIAWQLHERHPDEELVVVVREGSDRSRLDGLRATLRVADIGDSHSLRRALTGARAVIHTPSLGFGHAPTVVAGLEAAQPERVVIFSTTSVFTSLPTHSKQTRLEAERLIRESGLPATIVRPTMIYGRPGDRNIERLLRFLTRSPLMPAITGAGGRQQPVHVDDLAEAVVTLATTGRGQAQVYNLPGPRPLTFKELVSQAASALARVPRFVTFPRSIALGAVRAWRFTGLPPRVSVEQLRRLQEDKSFDTQRAARDFGYKPREFIDGVVEEARLLGLECSLRWQPS